MVVLSLSGMNYFISFKCHLTRLKDVHLQLLLVVEDQSTSPASTSSTERASLKI